MRKNEKKAFTLTELLIVVIVIGVLSAAVLPKFNKVIETRKTTEAEELMASVRTEQEKRCALDKRYLTQMSEMTDIVKNNETKNFTIALAGRGIDATRKDKYSYTLKMLSYADGRICCDGKDCSKLNKEYPTCEELKGKPDYQESPENCAGPENTSPGACDIDPYSCECNPNQEKCCTEDEIWQDGKCAPKPKECTGTKPPTSRECNKCGHQTQTVTCDTTTGEWVEGGFDDCDVKDESECPTEPTETCADKYYAGTLKSYCKGYGLFPGNWDYDTPLSSSNCCLSCEDAGGFQSGEECVYSYWVKSSEKLAALRYGEDYPNIALRSGSDFWGWSSPDGFAQYGFALGQFGASWCDFSGTEIPKTSFNRYDEGEFQKKCQLCGDADSCDHTDYHLTGNWTLVYNSDNFPAETACCLYGNDSQGATLGNLERCEGITLEGQKCQTDTDHIDNPAARYSDLTLDLSMQQIKAYQEQCKEAQDTNESNKIRCKATGIPSAAYTSSSTFLQEVGNDCRVYMQDTHVVVYGASVEKWMCVRDDENGGNPIY